MNKFWLTEYALSQSKVGIYVTSKHKCATTFLENFYGILSIHANRTLNEDHLFDFISFEQNSQPTYLDKFCSPERLLVWDNQSKITTRHNFCCACSRKFEIDIVDHKNHDEIWYIFQIRDPRDILVSEYFSYGWFHEGVSTKYRKEIQQIGIDLYCKRASEDLIKYFEKMLRILKRLKENIIILTYEQMILDFYNWINQAIVPFRFQKHSDIQNMIFDTWKSRVEPPKIEQKEHKRKVSPGDHREKLKPTTIEYLTRRFKKFLKNERLFSYDYNYS